MPSVWQDQMIFPFDSDDELDADDIDFDSDDDDFYEVDHHDIDDHFDLFM